MTAVSNVAEAVEANPASHLHPIPSWDVADHPLPTGREEVWRFTPLRRLRGLLEAEASGNTLEWTTQLPAGVSLAPISAERARELSVEAPIDRVSALAALNAGRGVQLDIPADTELSEPILLTGNGTGQAVAEHLVITVGPRAKATIVVRYTGSGTFADKTDISVGDGASLTFVAIADWDAGTTHGGHHAVLVGRDAQVRTVTASLGGDLIRLAENARFAGPGGSLEQFGVYFVDAGQHIEHRMFVDHNAPHTTSHVDYRGALQGQGAHSVWVGDVLIRKVAEGITTYETNKNLVLTDGCRADSVPNLEIETGEIEGAGHSSTTGRFDDEQLFYLRSRGIPEDEARRLVVHGFFADIIRRIGVPEVEARLMIAVEAELEVIVGGSAQAVSA
ncbi:Fe-S cluster assembly protein SufD [Propionicimonas sp.]|uniref:Fe-S cluster assembly protein SufD n=1 Tax=Propionicimonas sp. TaxID=1955623 RepID=UPI0017CFDCFE|nr:Fe-S cluster assembly protein SufD [Propionicimonas sp.]MBU3977594.1 Fe-S cluster assembly protein SufD [Actinomycetota bacterium]MBA3021519.1 Fe-S cluster assembly protein SufD [Propionicimonas sp.]MBU3987068.1 Fe-S cluster assembly protein SufD [Actinomycetota bacterium]MBU4008889.1 Fe-S cluster assembly protein SufD [Actinomycetota bacterium]MBU4065961.1 Fe-S cluster assembly protein SufD [Actinomycetota bacterium]